MKPVDKTFSLCIKSIDKSELNILSQTYVLNCIDPY